MADVPKDILEQIKGLERLFTVDQSKLKEITDHFVKELTKGNHSRDWLDLYLADTSTKVSRPKAGVL